MAVMKGSLTAKVRIKNIGPLTRRLKFIAFIATLLKTKIEIEIEEAVENSDG